MEIKLSKWIEVIDNEIFQSKNFIRRKYLQNIKRQTIDKVKMDGYAYDMIGGIKLNRKVVNEI